jgi:hypothetical protein
MVITNGQLKKLLAGTYQLGYTKAQREIMGACSKTLSEDEAEAYIENLMSKDLRTIILNTDEEGKINE